LASSSGGLEETKGSRRAAPEHQNETPLILLHRWSARRCFNSWLCVRSPM
jgi:hypothetical protein